MYWGRPAHSGGTVTAFLTGESKAHVVTATIQNSTWHLRCWEQPQIRPCRGTPTWAWLPEIPCGDPAFRNRWRPDPTTAPTCRSPRRAGRVRQKARWGAFIFIDLYLRH